MSAQAGVLALDRIPSGTVVNVVDDRPMRQRDLYRLFATYTGGPPPAPGPAGPAWGSLRVSNALARGYGFRPRYPDVAAWLRAYSLPGRAPLRHASSRGLTEG